MRFVPFVLDKDNREILVTIEAMTSGEAEATNGSPKWQTSWTSDYISNDRLEKYSAKVGDELIALGAYEILDSSLIVRIVYMEAQPDSNPTMRGSDKRKYRGIGRMLIAYGIKLSIDNGFHGDVILEAKTAELEEHYKKDFGAVKLPSLSSSAPRYIIADEAAKRIFFTYLV